MAAMAARFDAGKPGRAALADLARSPNVEIARLAKQAQTTTSRYDVEQATIPPRTPTITAWPADALLPLAFTMPVKASDPRYACGRTDGCVAVMRDHPGEFAVLLHPVPLEPSCNPHYRSVEPDHVGACELARLALTAWRADPDRFPDVHRLLFEKGGLDLPGTRSEVEALVGKTRLDAARRDPWVERQLAQNVATYPRLIERNNRMPKLILAPGRLMHGLARDPAAFRRVLREHAGIGAAEAD